ncbi:MAG: tyrosine-protein phosphatase [Clostridia bacterium]|nr:tyrosine-protein phosphatase [Clostridia bacterium]
MKKSILIKSLVFSVLCLAAVGLVGCNDNRQSTDNSASDSSSGVVEPVKDYTGVQTLNGFENNDDLYAIKQLQTNFDLTFTMDITSEQKKEGENSLKIYYQDGTFGNVIQPLTTTDFADCKVEDIKSLSLWVYNANEVVAPITLSALKTGSVAIAQEVFNLPVGEWTKCTLDLNKVAMESNAEQFYAFAFNFSKSVKNATYYVDEMQIEFGAEYTAADEQNLVKVNDLIARINALPETVSLANEEAMKGIYTDYKALDVAYQGAVSNYDKFEQAVKKLLIVARGTVDYTKDSVACYFDKFYGTFQAERGVGGFPNFSYSEEVKYKDEEGSLCIECTGDDWTYVNLTTMVPIAEYATTTCAVYNGLDKRIAAYFGWKQMTIINPGEWATFELDNRDYPWGLEFDMAALDEKGSATAAYGNVYISQMVMHPKEAEREVYTLYDMNNFNGIAKETFSGVFTYDESFETVQMDGYGDVLKLTASNVITYESSNGASTGVVAPSKNVAISYISKSAALDAYDTVKFSIYNPYNVTVPIHIMDTSWGTGPDAMPDTGDEDLAYYYFGNLKANAWTEFEMSVENFIKAGKILLECHVIMREYSLDSVEFYISDITAYGRLYVMSLIDDLPEAEVITAADKETVLSVLAEYEKLSDEHKSMVGNYDKLEECLQVVSKEAEGVDILSPTGEVFPYIEQAKAYLQQTNGESVANYCGTFGSIENAQAPVRVQWTCGTANVAWYTVEYSTKADYADALVEVVEESKFVDLYNLYKGTEYYVRVKAYDANGEMLAMDESTFQTTNLGPRVMNVDGIHNVRDLGGYTTSSDKQTVQGLLYRGGTLTPADIYSSNLTEAGKIYMSEIMGIKTDIDFRTYAEAGNTTSPIPNATLTYLGIGGYSDMLMNGNTKTLFSMLADEKNYPVYMHCTGGADRTGTAAFLINALLGVSEEQLIQDYEFTSFSIYGERNTRSGGYADYFKDFRDKLNAYDGDTLQEKTENFLLSIGVTADEIYNIKAIMFGEPTKEIGSVAVKEALELDAYMNFGSEGTLVLNNAEAVVGTVAVGYGKRVCVRMQSQMESGSSGGIYVFIGSYGFMLRGDEFRPYTKSVDGSLTEIARNTSLACDNEQFNSGNMLLYLTVEMVDGKPTMTIEFGEESVLQTYVYTFAEHCTNEIASENAVMTFAIRTDAVNVLTIYNADAWKNKD